MALLTSIKRFYKYPVFILCNASKWATKNRWNLENISLYLKLNNYHYFVRLKEQLLVWPSPHSRTLKSSTHMQLRPKFNRLLRSTSHPLGLSLKLKKKLAQCPHLRLLDPNNFWHCIDDFNALLFFVVINKKEKLRLKNIFVKFGM